MPVATITIDPRPTAASAAKSRSRASGGKKMGTGPGSNANGNFISDIEIRYSLGRGDFGVYTYCIFEHPPHTRHPPSPRRASAASSTTSLTGCCVRIQHHNKLYPKDARENKYDYTTVQFDHPRLRLGQHDEEHAAASSSIRRVEYLSGGPTKVEFLCHRDTNPVAAPCVLNYWRSSHYGGASRRRRPQASTGRKSSARF